MLAKEYQKIINKQLKYIGTWLPGIPIELGAVGILKQGTFQRVTSLSELKIKYKTRTNTNRNGFNITSEGILITGGNTGGTMPKASAKISVEFQRANSLLLRTKGVVHHIISDHVTIGVAIKDLKNKGIWKQNWIVVTEVVEVESATILFSTSANNQVDLETRILEGAIGNLNIADASLGWKMTRGKNLGVEMIAEEKMTPLFKASKIKKATNRAVENFAELSLKDIENDSEEIDVVS